MKFKLFEVTIRRADHTVRGHVVAPSQDVAALTVVNHDEALGLTHEDFSLEWVDETLGEHHRLGLDDLLENAPVGFASYCDIGWVAHTAPVQQLKLYRTTEDKGGDVFAIAPNTDIAAAIFSNVLTLPSSKPKMLRISDGMADMPAEMVTNLPQLLELGPAGNAEFNPGEQRWFVW